MKAYTNALKFYATFTGRTSRQSYWVFVLFNLIFMGIISSFDVLVLNHYSLFIVYNIVMFIPTMAASARRLHDTNHSAWWLLISLVPIIGEIWLLILLLSKGDIITNNYGNPE